MKIDSVGFQPTQIPGPTWIYYLKRIAIVEVLDSDPENHQ